MTYDPTANGASMYLLVFIGKYEFYIKELESDPTLKPWIVLNESRNTKVSALEWGFNLQLAGRSPQIM